MITVPPLSSAALRRDLSERNGERAQSYEHELSYGPVPSVIYREDGGGHGNFIPESYRAICRNPEWRKRLMKRYTGEKWVPRARERKRRELDCANSSDALLMNIFCYPKALRRPQLCALLGLESGMVPEFGFKPRIPLLPVKDRRDRTERGDCTEVDMRIGELLVEAKLTESALQPAPTRLLSRYRDLHDIFNVEELRTRGDRIYGYQLVRGVLAAHATECSFCFSAMRGDQTSSRSGLK